MKDLKNNVNNEIQSVELNLLNGQVDILLRSLELYGYNLQYMLNTDNVKNEEREEKIALLKFTYEQIQVSQSEQTGSKEDKIDNTSSILEMLNKDINSINFENKANLKVI